MFKQHTNNQLYNIISNWDKIQNSWTELSNLPQSTINTIINALAGTYNHIDEIRDAWLELDTLLYIINPVHHFRAFSALFLSKSGPKETGLQYAGARFDNTSDWLGAPAREYSLLLKTHAIDSVPLLDALVIVRPSLMYSYFISNLFDLGIYAEEGGVSDVWGHLREWKKKLPKILFYGTGYIAISIVLMAINPFGALTALGILAIPYLIAQWHKELSEEMVFGMHVISVIVAMVAFMITTPVAVITAPIVAPIALCVLLIPYLIKYGIETIGMIKELYDAYKDRDVVKDKYVDDIGETVKIIKEQLQYESEQFLKDYGAAIKNLGILENDITTYQTQAKQYKNEIEKLWINNNKDKNDTNKKNQNVKNNLTSYINEQENLLKKIKNNLTTIQLIAKEKRATTIKACIKTQFKKYYGPDPDIDETKIKMLADELGPTRLIRVFDYVRDLKQCNNSFIKLQKQAINEKTESKKKRIKDLNELLNKMQQVVTQSEEPTDQKDDDSELDQLNIDLKELNNSDEELDQLIKNEDAFEVRNILKEKYNFKFQKTNYEPLNKEERIAISAMDEEKVKLFKEKMCTQEKMFNELAESHCILTEKANKIGWERLWNVVDCYEWSFEERKTKVSNVLIKIKTNLKLKNDEELNKLMDDEAGFKLVIKHMKQYLDEPTYCILQAMYDDKFLKKEEKTALENIIKILDTVTKNENNNDLKKQSEIKINLKKTLFTDDSVINGELFAVNANILSNQIQTYENKLNQLKKENNKKDLNPTVLKKLLTDEENSKQRVNQIFWNTTTKLKVNIFLGITFIGFGLGVAAIATGNPALGIASGACVLGASLWLTGAVFIPAIINKMDDQFAEQRKKRAERIEERNAERIAGRNLEIDKFLRPEWYKQQQKIKDKIELLKGYLEMVENFAINLDPKEKENQADLKAYIVSIKDTQSAYQKYIDNQNIDEIELQNLDLEVDKMKDLHANIVNLS
jgi:hypothetical protein